MIKYVLRRLLWVFLSVIAFSFIAFVTLELTPGDFFTLPYIYTNPPWIDEDVENLQEWCDDYTERFALDKPFMVRYAAWVRQFVVYGDWGQSRLWWKPVRDIYSSYGRFWLTVVLVVSSLFFSWLIAIPLGMLLAHHQGTFLDGLGTLACRINSLIPAFILATVMMWYAMSGFDQSIKGLYSQDYILASWSWAKIGDMLGHIWIPISILLFGSISHSTLVMRKSTLQVIEQGYLDVARAQGVDDHRLLWRYILPDALGRFFESERDAPEHLLSSCVLMALVLELQTTAQLMSIALIFQDMFLSAALLFFLGVFCIFGRALLDILRAALDPRVRAEL